MALPEFCIADPLFLITNITILLILTLTISKRKLPEPAPPAPPAEPELEPELAPPAKPAPPNCKNLLKILLDMRNLQQHRQELGGVCG